ncbi:MAG: hypothetical protein WCW64_00530 [Phycisphaerae bacterium]|jgi:hypothetical protein
MTDCEKLATCAFFKAFEADASKSMALKGFAAMYCKGDKQNTCIRKKVSKALGGPEHVPKNMMPNGQALPGTNDINWGKDVRAVMKA